MSDGFSDPARESHNDGEPQEVNPTSPRVSVAMPVYNGEKYLAEAIDSILAQSFTDFEFLIISDGSTDRTVDILEQYAARDDRIHFLHRENRGIPKTLNELLKLAKGELVARMDADDIAFPERFSKQVRYLDETPDCVVVGSSAIIIDPNGRELQCRNAPPSHEEITEGFLNGICTIFHPAAMFRRAPILELGGYREDTRHAEDLDLFLRLAETKRLANLPDPLLKYREHLGKIGETQQRDQTEIARRYLIEAHQRRGLTPPESLLSDQFTPRGPADKYRVWGWWALSGGNIATARRYALKALSRRPFSPENWRLAACAVRGR